MSGLSEGYIMLYDSRPPTCIHPVRVGTTQLCHISQQRDVGYALQLHRYFYKAKGRAYQDRYVSLPLKHFVQCASCASVHCVRHTQCTLSESDTTMMVLLVIKLPEEEFKEAQIMA